LPLQQFYKSISMIIKALFFIPIAILLSSFLISNENGNQQAYYYCSKPRQIGKRQKPLKQDQTYFHFNKKLSPKDFKSQDFVWSDNDKEKYFIAYLINTTDSTFKAELQDGSLIMIQEALNEKNEWQPIEYWVNSGCGNSYESLKIQPGQYVIIRIIQYAGSFKTKIRLKMRKAHSILYSEPFEGTVDKSQFEKQIENVGGIEYYGPPNYLD